MSWFKRKTAKPKPPAPTNKGFDALDDLGLAAERGDVKALTAYFHDCPSDYFAQSLSGHFALVAACGAGQTETARYMLDLGVPADAEITGRTAETAAAEGGHVHILLLLREYTLKVGKQPTDLMEKAQALADAQKMLEMTKVVITAPVLQNDITVRDKPLKFKKPPSP
ncbi:MAG: ankyrin repeat domain-containing protein [Alphaproteobacteria bacterium]